MNWRIIWYCTASQASDPELHTETGQGYIIPSDEADGAASRPDSQQTNTRSAQQWVHGHTQRFSGKVITSTFVFPLNQSTHYTQKYKLLPILFKIKNSFIL